MILILVVVKGGFGSSLKSALWMRSGLLFIVLFIVLHCSFDYS